MASETRTGLEGELSQAIDELHAALQHATDATASIRALLPKVGSIGRMFDELDAVIQSGRQQIGEGAASGTSTYPRPTLVQSTSAPTDSAPPTTAPVERTISQETPESVKRAEAAGLTCFRLEFESRPGPLDLRTVDDAVSEHPAVRDVALLDYDGRKATLKVWIDGSAKPAEVQSSLIERSPQLFNAGNDVTIVALEDVA